ncbi:AraC family transcriptional regulator [Arenibacter aquaticus]|uniref:AraC family transcriptional regulator n=1 Tax=Arenibacter aquaticus TaxID=2489054 RepID=A0A430K2A0_9FLAO|nr:AraC family transcriptional regulator [Arenibacter aquaticus]RTE53098.1 AraC family transcriptional regulator [Arenibacter aquaticus]
MKSALQKSPIPKSQAFVAKLLRQPNFDPSWHFHPEFQLFMVLKGSGTRFIGDHVKHFKEGNITFTGPNLPHMWRSDNEGLDVEDNSWSEGIVVYFHEDFIGQGLLHKTEMIKLRQLFQRSLRGIDVLGDTANKVGNMMKKLLYLEGMDSVVELFNILNCLANTSESELLASPGYTNSLKQGDTERMNDVHAYVMKNFKEKIQLSTVASLANMTPTSFSRYFKMHANKTFSEFLTEIRIGYACKLLIEEKMNIGQACYASGFQTLSNFNKQFKTITKRTPMSYKKKYGI